MIGQFSMMEDTTEFSVVIPCYNSSKSIARALKSLELQSFKNFDVILVDDFSLDFNELLSEVKKFDEVLNITVVRNLKNMGGGYSRNKGVRTAKGKNIAFLDSDDELVNNRLLNAHKIIKDMHCDFLIYGKFELISGEGKGTQLPLRGIRQAELVSDYVFAAGQLMQTSTFVCPKKTALKIQFDEDISRHQDSDFVMRAQQKCVPIYFQEDICAKYYMSKSDMLSRLLTKRIDSGFCREWLVNKRGLMSSRSNAGYTLTVFSRVLYLEGRKINAILLGFLSFFRLGLDNILWLTFTKLIVISNRWKILPKSPQATLR